MGGSHICSEPRWGDPISTGSQTWDPISTGNLDGGGGIPYLEETYMGGGGDPMSAGNLDGWRDLISAGNLDWRSHTCRKPRWGEDPKPTVSHMRNPISAGNLDGGWGIPNLQET